MDLEGERLRRIVRIEARFDSGDPQFGTGFRIGPGHVLSAQHVVERGHAKTAIERATQILVRLDEDGSGEKVVVAPATVAWTGEAELDPDDPKALDAAVLVDELPAGNLEPFRDWVQVPLGSSGGWESEGFAAASLDIDPLGTEYLYGLCHPARERATYLKLTVDRSPPRSGKKGAAGTWAGISGGPVFVKEGLHQGHLYGVVRSSPRRFPDVLRAVGTPALLRNVELRRLLDINEPMPPHAGLVEKLREVLDEDPLLAERLAKLDATWQARWRAGDTDALVDVLCSDGRLKPVLEQLKRLYGGEDPKSANGQRIRELALVLVSILAGREVPGGEQLDVESARRIQLGTASPNFAEALLASAYGTPCLFDKAADADLPHAWLRVPTGAMEGGLRASSRIDEQLEELLVILTEKSLDDPRFLLPAQKALVSTLPPGERRQLLRELLKKSLTRLEERHGRPAYLVADGELQKTMGDHLGTFLDRLAKILPNLDLVVLETGVEPVTRAIEKEDELWPLWEILDLLPNARSAR